MVYDFTGRAEECHKDPLYVATLEALAKGKRLTTEQKKVLTSRVNEAGIIKHMGWCYNFRKYVKKYVIKTEYYLEETMAYNKTVVRKRYGTGLGRIHYIVEVPTKK